MKKKKLEVLKLVVTVIVIITNIYLGIYAFNYVYMENKIDKKYEKYLISKERKNALEKYKAIGIIRVSKLNLEYNILNESKEDALDISVGKLYGSNPSEVGNMCIIGRNLNNKLFFSKINTLIPGDKIEIEDVNKHKVEYAVYDVYDTPNTDSEFLNQITGGKRELTLITDSKEKNQRTIVKAREI